jgi:hypothetical protein
MKERPSNGASVVEAWTQLADTTMAGYPAAPIVKALAKASRIARRTPGSPSLIGFGIPIPMRLWCRSILGKFCMSSKKCG